jgi:hypothetical protein
VKIVALVVDLMDRSRLSSAVGDIAFARDVAGCAGADVVVIDLARDAAAVASVRAAAPDARVVAFGPHVDTDVLDGVSPVERVSVTPPTLSVVVAWIVVVPAVGELIVTVQSPVVPTVVHWFEPTNAPGPAWIEPVQLVPAGAFVKPPDPSFTLM